MQFFEYRNTCFWFQLYYKEVEEARNRRVMRKRIKMALPKDSVEM